MTALLITGAIDISAFNIPATKVTNTEQRLSQYLSSIKYAIDCYRELTHLIFCENTGYNYDYSEIEKNAREKGKFFEALTFIGDYATIQQRGKGYGEGEIINYALANSEYLRDCQSFYKLTGRLMVINMDRIIDSTQSGNAFDFQPGAIYNRKRDHIETIFYKTDSVLYRKYLHDAYQEVEESRFQYLEHIFYNRLKGMNLKSFRILPEISGQSGTTGKEYDKPTHLRIIEKFYYTIGIHNLYKNSTENFLYYLLIGILSIQRWMKGIIIRDQRVNLTMQ